MNGPIYVADYEPARRRYGDDGPRLEALEASFRACVRPNPKRQLFGPRGQSQTAEAKRKRAQTAEAIALGYDGPRQKISATLVAKLRERRAA